MKSLIEDYASTSSSARTSSGSCTASASAECFRIPFLQDFAPRQSSGHTPVSSMFLNILGGRLQRELRQDLALLQLQQNALGSCFFRISRQPFFRKHPSFSNVPQHFGGLTTV